MTTAYVYKWTHLPTMKWYVGSRCKKGCHPYDGYICSSKVVKPLILKNQSEWKREIIAIGNKEEMLSLEIEILNLFDAKNDTSSFNMHNGNGRFNGSILKGIKKTEQHREKLKKHLDAMNKIYRVGKTGTFKNKTHSKSTKKVLSEKRSGINGSNGWYTGPCGKKFETAKQAALAYNVSHTTIYRWIKKNLNGWNLILKNS